MPTPIMNTLDKIPDDCTCTNLNKGANCNKYHAISINISSPMPTPTIIETIEKEYDSVFPLVEREGKTDISKEIIAIFNQKNVTHKSFLHTALLRVRESTLDEVRNKAKGMIIKNPKCYCKTHPEHNCGFTSNDAVSDFIASLK